MNIQTIRLQDYAVHGTVHYMKFLTVMKFHVAAQLKKFYLLYDLPPEDDWTHQLVDSAIHISIPYFYGEIELSLEVERRNSVIETYLIIDTDQFNEHRLNRHLFAEFFYKLVHRKGIEQIEFADGCTVQSLLDFSDTYYFNSNKGLFTISTYFVGNSVELRFKFSNFSGSEIHKLSESF